jgi:hypothetical protein
MTLPTPFAANLFKALTPLVYSALPPAPNCAYITQAGRLLATGQGHNATTVEMPTVVTTVVGFYRWLSTIYPPPTTAQRQNPDTYMYTCAPVRTQGIIPLWPLWRCGLLYLFDNLKEIDSKGHNGWHNGSFQTVVGRPKPLENLNKGGFCCG